MNPQLATDYLKAAPDLRWHEAPPSNALSLDEIAALTKTRQQKRKIADRIVDAFAVSSLDETGLRAACDDNPLLLQRAMIALATLMRHAQFAAAVRHVQLPQEEVAPIKLPTARMLLVSFVDKASAEVHRALKRRNFEDKGGNDIRFYIGVGIAKEIRELVHADGGSVSTYIEPAKRPDPMIGSAAVEGTIGPALPQSADMAHPPATLGSEEITKSDVPLTNTPVHGIPPSREEGPAFSPDDQVELVRQRLGAVLTSWGGWPSAASALHIGKADDG